MSTAELFQRHAGNPILTAADWPYPVNAVFNPAATAVNGETVLLARVEDRRGISHLTVARSANGLDGWSIEPEPLLAPDDETVSEPCRSDDLVSWSTPEQVLQPRAGAWWDSLRIGIGPPPLRTEHGWLLLYHGVKETVAGEIYRVGLALLDLNEPARVLRRLPNWILAPLALYERAGDVPNVVFPCGIVHDAGSDEVRLYYGTADSSICVATARLDDLLAAVLAAPPNGEES